MFKSDLFFKDRSNVECDDILYQNKFTAILTLTKKPQKPVGTEKPTLSITLAQPFFKMTSHYEFLVILNQNRTFQTNLCTVFQKHFDYFIYTIVVLVFDLNDDILMYQYGFESQM